MGGIERAERPGSSPPGADRRIAALAARQHGLVTRSQLRELGLSPSTISRRLSAGRLHPLHRGVYAVGHPLVSAHGTRLAAVLACGPGAALSHRSAGAHWGLVRWTGRPHVTAARSRGPLPGIVVHRGRRLSAEDTTVRDGVPCTAWARTIVDLSAHLTVDRLVRALEAAALSGLYDHAALTAAIDDAAGVRGVRRLREAIAEGHHLSPAGTRSVLEEAFLAIVRRPAATIPAPRTNVMLTLEDGSAFEVDVLWAGQRLVVELDGRRYHELEGARRRDRSRDAALRRHGYAVMRLTWADVTRHPGATLRRVERALGRIEIARRGASGPPRDGA